MWVTGLFMFVFHKENATISYPQMNTFMLHLLTHWPATNNPKQTINNLIFNYCNSEGNRWWKGISCCEEKNVGVHLKAKSYRDRAKKQPKCGGNWSSSQGRPLNRISHLKLSGNLNLAYLIRLFNPLCMSVNLQNPCPWKIWFNVKVL